MEISDPLQDRMVQLVELDETRREGQKENVKLQQKMKCLFDKRATLRKFQSGDMVLQWNVRAEDKGEHKKFESLWLGPLVVYQIYGKDSYLLSNLEGEE